uniref:phage portal protein family protein n=1 Tax=Ornithobacterium rhinotracheale TaxID=28251 RepID=UPI0039A6AFB6
MLTIYKFYRKIEALDKELSKLVLHQTMTTENGSSRAQGGVHENTLKEVIYADNKKMLAFLNNKLIPAMRNLGYAIPENAKIQIEQVADPKEQIAVDGVLLGSGYILKKEYIEQTYGVEIEQMPSVGVVQTNNEASAKKP